MTTPNITDNCYELLCAVRSNAGDLSNYVWAFSPDTFELLEAQLETKQGWTTAQFLGLPVRVSKLFAPGTVQLLPKEVFDAKF